MVYVCSHWFEESKRALLVGLANSIAMLGGIFGEGPLSFFVHQIGWRWSLISLGFIGFGLAFLIFLNYVIIKLWSISIYSSVWLFLQL